MNEEVCDDAKIYFFSNDCLHAANFEGENSNLNLSKEVNRFVSCLGRMAQLNIGLPQH